MSIISRAIRRATAVAFVAGALLITACTTAQQSDTQSPDAYAVEQYPPVMYMGGVTDDVVEVYRIAGSSNILEAAFLMHRTEFNGPSTEYWIWGNGVAPTLDPSQTYYLWAGQSTAGFTVSDMCALYDERLGYPDGTDLQVILVDFPTPTTDWSKHCSDY